MKVMQRLIGFLVLFGIATATVSAQEGRKIGFVNRVSGIAVLRSSVGPKANQEMQLKGGRAVLHPLHDGDVLRCEPGSSVTITISGQPRKLTEKDGNVTLHPPYRELSYRKLTKDEQRVEEAINRFGLPGGSRSIGSLVWWPADGSAVSLENFRVRWNPPLTAEPFKIVISTEAGEQIWSVEGVDSAKGALTAEQGAAIHGVLQQHQKDSEAQNFILTVISEMQGSLRNTFSVPSRQEEARIRKELQDWDKRTPDPLLRIVGRIDTLKSANLYCDVAEEYEIALQLVPNSEALLRAALDANQRVGNLERTHDLNKRLQAALSEDTLTSK